MNAISDTAPRAVAGAVHPTHKFQLLLRREFWEHKGGFFWAPLVAGAIFLMLTLMGLGAAEIAGRRATGQQIDIDGTRITVGALDIGTLTSKIAPEDLKHVGGAIDITLFTAAGWSFAVLMFVVFFYCLGSLYDDRKDRSVLFWKSLPLSDTQTVLSKVASATIVAPIIATLAGIATMFVLMILLTGFIALHGGNPMTLLWGPASPLQVAGTLLAMLPVYALWMLPTVGWLMLCSAFARSKPFLWAVMIPAFSAIAVAWFDLMQFFDLDTAWFMKNIAARALGSTIPMGMLDAATFPSSHLDGPGAVHELFNLSSVYSVMGSAQLWLGVLAGAAMIAASIRLRRWRDEG